MTVPADKLPHLYDAEMARIEAARRMTAAQKIAAIHSLRKMAWNLKASSIRRRNPLLSEEAVQSIVREAFLRAGS